MYLAIHHEHLNYHNSRKYSDGKLCKFGKYNLYSPNFNSPIFTKNTLLNRSIIVFFVGSKVSCDIIWKEIIFSGNCLLKWPAVYWSALRSWWPVNSSAVTTLGQLILVVAIHANHWVKQKCVYHTCMCASIKWVWFNTCYSQCCLVWGLQDNHHVLYAIVFLCHACH